MCTASRTVKVFGRARKQLCFVQELSTRVSYLQLCKLGDKFKPIAGGPREAWHIAKEKSKHDLKHVKVNQHNVQSQAISCRKLAFRISLCALAILVFYLKTFRCSIKDINKPYMVFRVIKVLSALSRVDLVTEVLF